MCPFYICNFILGVVVFILGHLLNVCFLKIETASLSERGNMELFILGEVRLGRGGGMLSSKQETMWQSVCEGCEREH